jgi:uracil-DNA glycosylase
MLQPTKPAPTHIRTRARHYLLLATIFDVSAVRNVILDRSSSRLPVARFSRSTAGQAMALNTAKLQAPDQTARHDVTVTVACTVANVGKVAMTADKSAITPRPARTHVLRLPVETLESARLARPGPGPGVEAPRGWAIGDKLLALPRHEHLELCSGFHGTLVLNPEQRVWALQYVDEFTDPAVWRVAALESLLPSDWRAALFGEFRRPYWRALQEYLLEKDRLGRIVYPPVEHIFAAFHHCPLGRIRACVAGQDPYAAPGQAHGLAFSVAHGVPVPPSLANIFTELKSDVTNFMRPNHGCLEKWANQGLLLLNSALTVTHQQPGSHSNSGWHEFTTAVLRLLNQHSSTLVFFAWGQHAQARVDTAIDDSERHLVLRAAHPSPHSANAGFFGCRHFSKCNEFLTSKNITTIDWCRL